MRCHIELKAIRNPGQLGNSGNTFRESLAIRNWETLAIVGNREWAITGMHRECRECTGNTGNLLAMQGIRQSGNDGNQAIGELGIREYVKAIRECYAL